MLVATDKLLFDELTGLSLYQDAFAGAPDYTADTSPVVVRFNSSEYQALYDESGDLKTPHIAVQLLGTRSDGINRSVHWKRGEHQLKYVTGTAQAEIYKIDRPAHRIVDYQLDVRSPAELWLRQIESEIDRRFSPVYESSVAAEIFGSTEAAESLPVRFTFSDPTRMQERSDLGIRILRTVYRVAVETWLLRDESELERLYTVQTVSPTVEDGDDTTLDTYSLDVT